MNLTTIRAAVNDTLGVPGIVGVGLLLFSLAFYVGTVSPVREELARLEGEKTQLAAIASAPFVGRNAPTAASAPLPPMAQLPDFLKRLDALAAAHGLAVQRTVYQIKGKEGPRRLEVDLPLKTGYPALRAYLRDALVLTPTASLDELNLQRSQASEPTVDAQLRLSFGFAPQ